MYLSRKLLEHMVSIRVDVKIAELYLIVIARMPKIYA